MVGFLAATVVAILVTSQPSTLAVAQTLGSFGVLLSAFWIALTYRLNSRKAEEERKWIHSKLMMEEAVEALGNAYRVLTVNEAAKVPPNDRLIWLTVARHLLAGEKLSREITDKAHKKVFNEKQEFWRARFYSLLDPLGQEGGPMDEQYFADDIKHTVMYSPEDRAPLVEQSVAKVLRFCSWPEERKDLLQAVPKFSEEEIRRNELFGHKGFAAFLRRREQYFESIKSDSETQQDAAPDSG